MRDFDILAAALDRLGVEMRQASDVCREAVESDQIDWRQYDAADARAQAMLDACRIITDVWCNRD
jgi:hypothetical protein